MVEKWVSNPVVNAMHDGAAIKLLATWGYHSQQNGRQSKESLPNRLRTGNKLLLMGMVIG
jgi:hypothetical protein